MEKQPGDGGFLRGLLLACGLALLTFDIVICTFPHLLPIVFFSPLQEQQSPPLFWTITVLIEICMAAWMFGFAGVGLLVTEKRLPARRRGQIAVVGVVGGALIALLGVIRMRDMLGGGDPFTIWFILTWSGTSAVLLILTQHRSKDGSDGLQSLIKIYKRITTSSTAISSGHRRASA